MRVSEAIRAPFAPSARRHPDVLRYALAVTTVALGTWLQRTLWEEQIAPFVLLYVAVVVTARVGGRGPGVLAALLGAGFGNVFLLRPPGRWSLASSTLLATVLFAASASFIAVLVGTLRRALEAANANAQKLAEAREQFRALAEGVPQLVWMTRPDGHHEYFNRHWYELTGTSLDEAGGDPWSRVLHPDDLERTTRQWRRSLQTGEPYEVEYRLRRASDGAYRWFLGRALPLRDDGGRIVRWFGTCTDIDEQKRTEAELAAERQRLQVILSSLPVGVFIADAGGRIIETNERARVIWGGSRPAEGPGDYAEYRGYWPDSDRRLSGSDWALSRALTHGEVVTGEIIDIERFDGRRARILNNAAPFRNASGEITGAAVIILDITEMHRAERELQRSERRYRALFENLPDAVFLTIPDGRIVAANPAACEMFGWTEEEIVRGGRDLLMDRDSPEFASAVEERRRMGRYRNRELTYFRKGGRRFFGETSSVILTEGPLNAFVIVRDITDRKRAEQALAQDIERRLRAEHALSQANERLRDADRRKDEFLAVLSHELRNPLAPIRNSIYVLRRGEAVHPNDQVSRALGVIDRQAQHMTRLVDDLLDVTRITRGKIKLDRQEVELNELLRGVVEDHRDLYARSRVSLELHEAPERLYVYGDRTRLAQVVGNLLWNAAKFTPAGGATALTLAAADTGEAVIRVRDTGEGLTVETISHLFEPFVQEDRTLARSRGGLGLGLALVKGLVEAHGGSVNAESPGPGAGSTFTIRLPVERAARAHLRILVGGQGGRRPRRILVIEDNGDAAESLKEVLAMNGHEVALAYSGTEGLEKARSFRPEIVLCDIGLPGMDGYAVVKAIRADRQLATTRVIALSGYAAPEDVSRSRAAGFDHHVAKPPDLDQLERLLVHDDDAADAGAASPH